MRGEFTVRLHDGTEHVLTGNHENARRQVAEGRPLVVIADGIGSIAPDEIDSIEPVESEEA